MSNKTTSFRQMLEACRKRKADEQSNDKTWAENKKLKVNTAESTLTSSSRLSISPEEDRYKPIPEHREDDFPLYEGLKPNYNYYPKKIYNRLYSESGIQTIFLTKKGIFHGKNICPFYKDCQKSVRYLINNGIIDIVNAYRDDNYYSLDVLYRDDEFDYCTVCTRPHINENNKIEYFNQIVESEIRRKEKNDFYSKR